MWRLSHCPAHKEFTFGDGKYGQLGHNSTQNELRPSLVTGLFGTRVTQIAYGRQHTLAYVSDLGKVFLLVLEKRDNWETVEHIIN